MKDAALYTVTYDIPKDSRRVKVANILKSFGERVQLSVFECWLSRKELKELEERLANKVVQQEDSVRIYPVSAAVVVLGLGEVTQETGLLLI